MKCRMTQVHNTTRTASLKNVMGTNQVWEAQTLLHLVNIVDPSIVCICPGPDDDDGADTIYLPVRRLLAPAGPGCTYSDSTVLATACGKGVSADCSAMRWEMSCCGMTNWAVPLRVVSSLRPGFCRHGALCLSSCHSAPALAILCPRGAEWGLLSARAMATLIRAYRKYARRRRSLRRLAAPVAGAWSTDVSTTEAILAKKMSHREKGNSLTCGGLMMFTRLTLSSEAAARAAAAHRKKQLHRKHKRHQQNCSLTWLTRYHHPREEADDHGVRNRNWIPPHDEVSRTAARTERAPRA